MLLLEVNFVDEESRKGWSRSRDTAESNRVTALRGGVVGTRHLRGSPNCSLRVACCGLPCWHVALISATQPLGVFVSAAADGMVRCFPPKS